MHWGLTIGLLAACFGCAGLKGQDDAGVRVFRATGIGLIEDLSAEEGGAARGLMVRAGGIGFPAPDAADDDQRRMTALEAATAVAMARLAGELEGVKVTRESRVHNLQFAGEDIVVESAAVLSGVRILESKYDAEKGEARVMLAAGLGRTVGRSSTDGAPPALHEAGLRAQAEQAARMDALAKLREQVGGVRLRQEVTVRNLALDMVEARAVVEGTLHGVEFSEPEWPDDVRCTVRAEVRLTPDQLAELRSLAAGAP